MQTQPTVSQLPVANSYILRLRHLADNLREVSCWVNAIAIDKLLMVGSRELIIFHLHHLRVNCLPTW